MGCRRASSTLLMVVLAIIFLLPLHRPVAHARHVKSPSMWTGEHSSPTKDEGLRGEAGKLGVEHTKKAEAVPVKGPTGEGAVGSSPAASAEKIVVARYGPRPHPKKHN